MGRRPHEVLGVRADASVEEIKKAYRKAAMRVHPDKTGNPNDTERFHEVKRAHDRMMQRKERPSYWYASDEDEGACGSDDSGDEDCFPGWGRGMRDVFGNNIVFGCMEPLMQQLIHRAHQRALFEAMLLDEPPRGTDVVCAQRFAQTDFSEQRTKRAEVTHWRRCRRCGGHGALGKWTSCGMCRGFGQHQGGLPCRWCQGAGGQCDGAICPTCKGERGAFAKESILFTLMAEESDGKHTRIFPGCGNDPVVPFGRSGDMLMRLEKL
jgi:DnaJ-class molecular chaperone